MARKTVVQLLDDIDGGKADETVTFGLDGTTYEIDLSSKHAEQLRTALAKYIEAGTKVGRGRVEPARRRRAGGGDQPARGDRAQNQAIRDWAKRKGIELSDRGRIARHIVEQYEAEAGR
jgi:hypothetical protein